jgi:hypothetical protein
MTLSKTTSSVADRVTAEALLDLLDARADQLAERLTAEGGGDRINTLALLDSMHTRAASLRQSLPADDALATMKNIGALLHVVDTLNRDLDIGAGTEPATGSSDDAVSPGDRELHVAEGQLRAWLGAVEELEMRATLGRMEARDEYAHLVERGHEVWHQVVRGLRQVRHDAAMVREDASLVRDDVAAVLVDLRDIARDIIAPDKSDR